MLLVPSLPLAAVPCVSELPTICLCNIVDHLINFRLQNLLLDFELSSRECLHPPLPP